MFARAPLLSRRVAPRARLSSGPEAFLTLILLLLLIRKARGEQEQEQEHDQHQEDLEGPEVEYVTVCRVPYVIRPRQLPNTCEVSP